MQKRTGGDSPVKLHLSFAGAVPIIERAIRMNMDIELFCGADLSPDAGTAANGDGGLEPVGQFKSAC